MSSHHVPTESGTQYERLVVAMAELRERSVRIVAEARAARAKSKDLQLMAESAIRRAEHTGSAVNFTRQPRSDDGVN